jgi:hypothetical protein
MTESQLDVSPLGLRGLNRLAIRLNELVATAGSAAGAVKPLGLLSRNAQGGACIGCPRA